MSINSKPTISDLKIISKADLQNWNAIKVLTGWNTQELLMFWNKSKSEKKLLIVVGYQLFREGLKAVLAGFKDIRVIGHTDNALIALITIKNYLPDLLLIDPFIERLNGFDLIKKAKKIHPGMQVLVLTDHASDQHIVAALEDRVNGYCHRSANIDELLFAIKSILNGKSYFCSEVTKVIIERCLLERESPVSASCWDKITKRQRKILKSWWEGYSPEFLSDLLKIMNTLGLHNLEELSKLIVEKGLFDKKSSL